MGEEIPVPVPVPTEAPAPIAIVGIGLRLPGQITTTDQFWDLLVSKRDTRSEVPGTRYNIDGFHSPSGRPGMIRSRYGHFLDCDLGHMDASFFSMSKAEVEKLDPQQRLLLEVAWACLENGGKRDWRGGNIGCYVGVFGEDWLDLSAKDPQHVGMYRITGTADFALSNRVSYELDLKGPSMTIQTGCSSSLVGLHEACNSIRSGDCDSALGVLSPGGMCKSFDASADGYVRGEAVNAVYVKKLSDAMRDGDPIRGVIRATAINFDGKTSGISNPSSESHEALMRRAYRVAHIENIHDTGFVECHGTGTPIGDPMEVSAVGRLFGGKGVLIGSVKPNVGHSEGASGLTSLIKATLALENETIPPNINFDQPSPKIEWNKFGLQVPTSPLPWPVDRLPRVSVNSFGIGGANAHVIIDSAKELSNTKDLPNDQERAHHLLLLSANHSESLKESGSMLEDYAATHMDRIADLSFTLGTRREHLAYRTYAIADGETWPLQMAPTQKPKGLPVLNFVFTGQGAQWAGMCADLLRDFCSFQRDIEAMDRALRNLPHPPLWTIEEELLKPTSLSRLSEPEFSQPICTAIQIGLVNLLRSCNVHPSAVVGHSSGEIAAAYAAGSLTVGGALAVAYYRGQVAKHQTRSGGMVAVGLSRNEVSSYLVPGVILACENSPSSVTLSGDSDVLDAVADRIRAARPDCLVRRLKVERAYHSHHMRDIGAEYEVLTADLVTDTPPTVPVFSSVTAKCITKGGQLGPSYWRANLESPVLFLSAAQSMLSSCAKEDSVFLEIGPHSALAGPLRDIFKSIDGLDSSPTYVPTLVRNENGSKSFLQSLGQLFQSGVPVDLSAITPGCKVLTDLPPYPWKHDAHYWNESRVSREWRMRQFPPHELLGSSILEADDLEPAWRNILRLDDVPWVRDHKITDDVVFPAAGYIAMIGEAIRQVSLKRSGALGTTGVASVVDSIQGFSLQQVHINAALVLRESESTEIVTHLRRVRLTSDLDSSWFEFSIATFNGQDWIKHCTGQARAERESGAGTDTIYQKLLEKHHRLVSSPVWYRTMKSVGLNYGPHFQGLVNITASPSNHMAAATIVDQASDRSFESNYQLHPTTIDFCLQLLMVAIANGLSRRFTKLYMPTYIDELYVGHGETHSDIRVGVSAESNNVGAARGTAFAMAVDGGTRLWLKGARLSPVDSGDASDGADTVAAAQLHWRPDVDLASPSDLIISHKSLRDASRKVERLSLLCTFEALHRVEGIDTGLEHLQKLRAWMTMQRQRAAEGTYEHVEDCVRLAGLNQEALQAEIAIAQDEVYCTAAAKVGEVVVRAAQNVEAIFKGEIESIEVLMDEGGLENIYRFMQSMCDYTHYIELIGHANPTLKVLEIGAGTGGTTAGILRGLTGLTEEGNVPTERMYSQYHYTDISTGFFTAAKERFKEYENIEYRVLDVSKDPLSQGFEAGSYDLVVASNVLHATPSLHDTLRNVRTLMEPGGKLFLQELGPVWRVFNFIMGFLPGWWLGEADGRPDEPFVSVSRWDSELREAGFSGTDAAVFDDEQPFQINANIISTAVVPQHARNRHVTILVYDPTREDAECLQRLLVDRGYHATFSSLDDVPPRAGQDVISMLDVQGEPFFHNIPAERLEKLQRYLGQFPSGSCLLWITGHAQVGCTDPRYGAVLGFARTVRSELSINFATLEIDIQSLDESQSQRTVDVYHKLEQRSDIHDGELGPDFEFVLLGSEVLVPRYKWLDLRQELSSGSMAELHTNTAMDGVSKEPTAVTLEVCRLGQLQTMQWITAKTPAVLEDMEVEIEPRAVGLNFKDVLVAMGIVDPIKPGLGLECAGVVKRVGSGAQQKFNLRAGDHVVAFDHRCFSSRFVTSAYLVAKMPEGLSFEDAATMPCVYTTVIHALINVGGLQKDQTVLIHSACGGVGIAAINLCKMIYATVGNPEKVEYLSNTFGVPSSNIFNSRDSSFYPDLMAATGGRGVDLVLNSLSGELLHLSWKCVADFGKMIEIGKRDLVGHGMLGMDLFEANRSYHGVEMSQMAVHIPEAYQILLQQCMTYYRSGAIKPIAPLTIFDAAQVIDSFRYLQTGQHIGKVVITMPQDPAEIETTPRPPQPPNFRSDASYLLCGGLGGLGRAVSTWMVENGARHLVYLSRSGGESNRDRAFIQELNAQRCIVQTFKGDATNARDVENAVRNAEKRIAGVMLMSMVLRDRNILQCSHKDWHDVVSPKVDGAYNLHNALTQTPPPLDFFVLFSSLSAVIGQIGQANYASANTFLAAFAQHRHSLSLPASVLDIGVMQDIGYLSENPAILEQLKAQSYHLLKEQDLLDALTFSLHHQTSPAPSTTHVNPAELVIGLRSTKPLTGTHNRTVWKRDIRMAAAHNQPTNPTTKLTKSTSPTEQDLTQFVASAEADPSLLDAPENRAYLTRQIGLRLHSFMFRPEEELDVGMSLTALGVDSLVAIEIRNWWHQTFGIDIGVLEIMSAASIAALGKTAADALRREFTAGYGDGEEGGL
ncbi:putative polyketide synthase [Podospora appendiculata]|uniref:Polyketide synthase n=1 Tax=Podospora appendiculata TaxID=314037 RepID=A0AAE0X4S8_9PEZI|nr:putative polyketide synthase [Podospora appendiculata]